MSCYLAFDLGTSAFKIALFDRRGRLIALSRQGYHTIDEHEVPPPAVWEALRAGVDEVLGVSHLTAADVTGVGIASQTNSMVLLGPGGHELTAIDLWTHNAADAEARELEQRFGADALGRTTGMPALLACQVLPKLVRLRMAAPALIGPDVRVRLLPDYVVEGLCGQAASDGSLWALTGLYDLQSGSWWPAALEAAGVSAGQLPKLARPGALAGRTTAAAMARLGLPSGIPVAVGSLDHLAAAVAVGNFGDGDLSESTGTVLCLMASTSAQPSAAPNTIVGPHADATAGYYRLSYSQVSAYWLDWYAEKSGLSQTVLADALAAAADVPPTCDGLAAVVGPSGDPADGPVFVNAATGVPGEPATHAHAIRAIMEAVAYNLADMMDSLAPIPAGPLPRGAGIPPARETGRQDACTTACVFAVGGGASSPLWLQIKADVLGLPIRTIECPQAAVLGAAIYAAVGAGQFADVRAAQAAWHRPGPTYVPDPVRRNMYAAQRKAMPARR